MTKGELTELIGVVNALIGLAGDLPGYRATAPTPEQEAAYQQLRMRLSEGLQRLAAENGTKLANPNQHSNLSSVWTWAWTLGDGRARKEAGRTLFTDLIEALETARDGLDNVDDGQMGTKDQVLPEIERRLSEGSPVAVLFIDLDGFKAVNDTLGHDAGDVCLDVVVATISAAIEGKGRLLRNGGDEFVVVLRNSTRLESNATAERIRAEIEAHAKAYAVTASIGLVSTDVHSTAPQELLKRADQAMYESKNGGKNRVTYAGA